MGVITLDREVGSLGDLVAKEAARKLGYRLVTHKEIHGLVEKCDTDFKEACSIFETEVSPGFIESFFSRDPSYSTLFASLILELACQDQVIILGRGAQFVLAELPGVQRIRIVAPLEQRVENITRYRQLDQDAAFHYVHHVDHQRRNLVESVFGHDVEAPLFYDLVINMANMTVGDAAEVVCYFHGLLPKQKDLKIWRQKLENMSLAKRVESAIKKKVPSMPYCDIRVEILEEGKVRLDGYAMDDSCKTTAQRIAEKFPNIKKVDNRVQAINLRF